jgi:hypothetical protein
LNHTWHECAPGCAGCAFCNGGLLYCTTCRKGEGELTPECPGDGSFVVDNAHSEFGPSAAERWLECPGSVLLTRGMKDPESWFAAEGTAAHTVSDWCRRENKPAASYIGRVLKVGEYEFTVDNEMAASVHQFVSAVEQTPGVAFYETRVHYDLWVPGGFGTLDDARLDDRVARVTDFKYGKGVQVFAENNPQLKLYAAGLYHDFGWLWPELDLFVLGIQQPRLDHVDEFEIQSADLIEWMYYEVRPIAERAALPGAPLKAGSHCQFCPAKRVCKVRADFVLQTVAGEFGDLDAPQNLALLTNDEVAKILPNLDIVRKWCKDVEAHALGELARGQPVGDWRVVEGRSNRAYSASEGEIARTLEPLLGGELWNPPTLKSPAQVETLLGGKAKAKDVLAPIVHKPKGKPTLVPGSDRRPEMVIDVTADFGDLDA